MYENIPMCLSFSGRQTLTQLEGEKLEAYLDTGGVWTIGVGHIRTAHRGMIITHEESQRLLESDLPRYERAVNKYVKVALSQRQFDALVIFCFNIGISAFAESTLVRKLNAELYDEADDEFGRWVYDNGKKIEGLKNRRQVEADLFRLGTFT